MRTVQQVERVLGATINTRILLLMGKSGITQQMIASRLRVHPSSVSHKLKGARRWTVEELYAVADLIGCRMSDVLPSVDEWRALRQDGEQEARCSSSP